MVKNTARGGQRGGLAAVLALASADEHHISAVKSQLEWPISKISEPACYGRHKREGNPSTCLDRRKGFARGNTTHKQKMKVIWRGPLSRSGCVEQALA